MGGGSDVAIQLKTKQRGAQTTADGSTLQYYYIPSVSTALQLEMAEKALRRLYSN